MSDINLTLRRAEPKSDHVPGIDGLRAIAVLAVILGHLNLSLLPGGFSGVDVFFVISGYVVSGSLARQVPATFPRFALSFYARRMESIWQALNQFRSLAK